MFREHIATESKNVPKIRAFCLGTAILGELHGRVASAQQTVGCVPTILPRDSCFSFFEAKRFLPLARVDVENLRRLTLHVRFPLPKSQLAAHFHEACRILLRAEFDTAHIEV